MSPASLCISLCNQPLSRTLMKERIWIHRVASEIVDPNVRSTLLLGGRVGGCLPNRTSFSTPRTIDVSDLFFVFFFCSGEPSRHDTPPPSPQGPNVNSGCVDESQKPRISLVDRTHMRTQCFQCVICLSVLTALLAASWVTGIDHSCQGLGRLCVLLSHSLG